MTPHPPIRKSMPPKPKGLLWEMAHPDRPEAASYLFGTMHVRDARAFGQLEQVYDCIRQCDTFAAELDLQAVAADGPPILPLPPTPPLDALLGPKVYSRLRKVLRKALHIPLDELRWAHPMAVTQMVDGLLQARDAPLPLDQHLFEYAAAQGCHLMGIETLEEQMAILECIPLANHVGQLKGMSRHFSRYTRRMHRILHTYERGDLTRLHRMANRGGGPLRRLLVDDRNRLMAERLAPLLHERRVCFAVGAGHLLGPHGLLRLLKHQGLRVREVKMGR